MCSNVGPSPGTCVPGASSLKKTYSCFWMAVYESLPHPCWNFAWLDFVPALCKQSQPVEFMHAINITVRSGKTCFCTDSQPPWLLVFLLPPPQCFLRHRCRSCGIDASITAGFLPICCSLHCVWLWFFSDGVHLW